MSSSNYTLEEQTIINIIRNNASVNQEEIGKLIGKSVRTVKTIMNKMQENGLIKRSSGKRNGIWLIL